MNLLLPISSKDDTTFNPFCCPPQELAHRLAQACIKAAAPSGAAGDLQAHKDDMHYYGGAVIARMHGRTPPFAVGKKVRLKPGKTVEGVEADEYDVKRLVYAEEDGGSFRWDLYLFGKKTPCDATLFEAVQ